jgi:hypothetical protein
MRQPQGVSKFPPTRFKNSSGEASFLERFDGRARCAGVPSKSRPPSTLVAHYYGVDENMHDRDAIAESTNS